MKYFRINIALTVVMLLPLARLMAQSSMPAPTSGDTKSDEFLLLGDADRGAGEPWVFINPKDPKNIIVAAMATLHVLPDGETPVPHDNSVAATINRVHELSVPDGSRTDIAITHDGGKTWTFSEDNFRKIFNMNRCSDSFAGSGPDGALYMGCLTYLSRGDAGFKGGYLRGGESVDPNGGTAIARSDDEGKTWSNPTWVQPLKSPKLYAPWLHPLFEQVGPTDRPNFTVDLSNNTIYLTGTGGSLKADTVLPPLELDPDLPDLAGKGYKRRSLAPGSGFRTYIRASHDGGKTWGVIYTTDTDDVPGGGFGGGVSAAFGHLVVTYSTQKAPASMNATCPCTVLGISSNDGKSYDFKLVPPLPADLVPPPPPAGAPGPRGGGFGGTMLAADPTKEGRYAIARAAGRHLYVSITEDGGNTWSAPVLASEAPETANFSQRAMKYSPEGVLGIIYKATYPNRTFDMWSAVSKDGGHTFSTVRVSHAVSPAYINDRGNFMFGDDLSSLDIDKDYLYVVWGDNRSGFEGTWFGKVPISAY